MRVLIVCSGNAGSITSFVKEQADSLINKGVQIDYYLINGEGIFGYLRNYPTLISKIRSFRPHIVHAHYGLSGLLANFQRKIPVITTFHGSDIHFNFLLLLSKVVILLSKYNIFVSSKLAGRAKVKTNYSIISCGVDLSIFKEIDKLDARHHLGLNEEMKYVLFSSSFTNKIKNYPLASEVVHRLKSIGFNVELLEFDGYDRNEANQLMNAVDCIIVTSFHESGPLVVKEGLACNCPIVATDVGDIQEVVGNTPGCFISSNDPGVLTLNLIKAIGFGKIPNGRNRVIKYDLDRIAENIYNVYNTVLLMNKS